MLNHLQGTGPIRFGGYRIDDRAVYFNLPGQAPGKTKDAWKVEVVTNKDGLRELPMKFDGVQWQTHDALILEEPQPVYYRFKKEGDKAHFKVDLAETVKLDSGEFNLIRKGAKNPKSNGPNLFIFPDSFVSEQQLTEKLALPDPQKKRDHFNILGGGFNQETIPILGNLLKNFGFKMTESRPIVGGNPISEWDRTGSHGYWTSNLFQRSPRLKTDADFENLVLSHLKAGSQVAFDAAFTSDGLNSIHYTSNLRYAIDSPFFKWFNYDKLHRFPFEPLKLGVLPTKRGDITNDHLIDYNAWDMRFIPPKHGAEQATSTWHVELYDPRLEDENGNPNPKFNLPITHYQASVQKYRFPVPGWAIKEKQDQLARAQNNPVLQKQLKRFWPNFHLEMAIHDNSGEKWDGQKDIARLRFTEHIVIQNNVRDAMKYWTEKVDRVITTNIASKLELAMREKQLDPKLDSLAKFNQWEQLAIDFNNQTHPMTKDIGALNQKPIRPGEIIRLLVIASAQVKDDATQVDNAAKLIRNMVEKNYHLESLVLPPNLQTLFSTEALHKVLEQGIKGPLLRIVERLGSGVRGNFQKLFPEFKPNRFLMGESFFSVLEKKLLSHFSGMKEHVRQKLSYQKVANLFYEDVANSVFLSILTGQAIKPDQVKTLSPEKIGEMVSDHVPHYVTNAAPKKAARMLAIWLSDELKKLDFEKLEIRQYLTDKARNLSSESIDVARFLMNKNSVGLNWRIDALKDLGNKDKTLSLDKTVRYSFWKKEANKINKFFDETTDEIRKINPQSIIRPELTRVDQLVGEPSETQNPRKIANSKIESDLVLSMLGDKRFDGMTNFHFINKHYGVVRAIGRPDEGMDALQVKPSEYVGQHLKNMMRFLPLEKVFQFQNLASNHDFSTSLYWLTLHPILARQDHFWWMPLGKQDGFAVKALDEAFYKKTLGMDAGLTQEQYQNLKDQILQISDQPNGFSRLVQPFLLPGDERVKANPITGEREKDHFKIPAPQDIKEKYIEELWQQLKPNNSLGLTQEKINALKSSFSYLLLEPSEFKAIRACLMNRLETLKNDTSPLNDFLPNLSNTQHQKLVKQLQVELPKAMVALVNNFPKDERRWLGYQQFDYVLDKAFKYVDTKSMGLNNDETQKLKQALYTEMLKPALAQYKRFSAVLNAIPGDPSHYMPDLFGQAGGENYNNQYIGNRELIRLDWVKDNPVLRAYHQDLAKIIKQRTQYSALNTGQLYFPWDPETNPKATELLDSTGVLPLIRDDGQGKHTLCLINLGKPNDGWQAYNQSNQSGQYADILPTQPKVDNFKMDLSLMGVAPKTRYSRKNSDSGEKEFYVVNDQGLLVCEKDPTKGVSFETDCIFEREAEVALPSKQFVSNNLNISSPD